MSALGLQDEKELLKEAKSLNPLFRVRNEIAHELDMTPESAGGRSAGTAAAALLWGELVHWRASRALTHSAADGTEAVVVLGFRHRDRERANIIDRWRVRAGLRSIDPRTRSSRLVLCGAPYHRAGLSEAALMAWYARKERGFTGDLLIEQESRSTWQNVANAIPLIEDTDRIKVVSHSVHARRARLCLQHQRPDLARRMVRAADYRPGESVLLQPLFAGYELLKIAKAKRTLDTDRGRQAPREEVRAEQQGPT